MINMSAKHIPPLRSQQVVRLQTEKGQEKIGNFKQPAAQPRSYIMQTEKKEYDRNRRHLLAVPEPAPAQWPFVASTPAYLAAAPHGSIAFHCVKCSSTASHHFKKGMLPVTSPATTAAKTSAEQSAVCSQSEVADKEAYQTPSSAKAFS